MSDALAAFALARIAEDEEWTRWASEAQRQEVETGFAFIATAAVGRPVASPARVLAECRVKRIIVQRYVDVGKANNGSDLANGMLMAHEADVRDLVSVWSDHPDFDEDWEF